MKYIIIDIGNHMNLQHALDQDAYNKTKVITISNKNISHPIICHLWKKRNKPR